MDRGGEHGGHCDTHSSDEASKSPRKCIENVGDGLRISRRLGPGAVEALHCSGVFLLRETGRQAVMQIARLVSEAARSLHSSPTAKAWQDQAGRCGAHRIQIGRGCSSCLLCLAIDGWGDVPERSSGAKVHVAEHDALLPMSHPAQRGARYSKDKVLNDLIYVMRARRGWYDGADEVNKMWLARSSGRRGVTSGGWGLL